MFENILEGVTYDDSFGVGGNGDWSSMRTEQYTKSVAIRGRIGIADQVEKELFALQEGRR
jgi:hypothetical protein